jgi:hypothetical protein
MANADGYTLYMPASSAFTVLPESKTKMPVLQHRFFDSTPNPLRAQTDGEKSLDHISGCHACDQAKKE